MDRSVGRQPHRYRDGDVDHAGSALHEDKTMRPHSCGTATGNRSPSRITRVSLGG